MAGGAVAARAGPRHFAHAPGRTHAVALGTHGGRALVATAGADGEVSVHAVDAAGAWSLLAHRRAHRGAVVGLALCGVVSSAATLWTAGTDGVLCRVRVSGVDGADVQVETETHASVESPAALASCGTDAALACSGGRIVVVSESGSTRETSVSGDPVAIACSPDGTLAVLQRDGAVLRFSVSDMSTLGGAKLALDVGAGATLAFAGSALLACSPRAGLFVLHATSDGSALRVADHVRPPGASFFCAAAPSKPGDACLLVHSHGVTAVEPRTLTLSSTDAALPEGVFSEPGGADAAVACAPGTLCVALATGHVQALLLPAGFGPAADASSGLGSEYDVSEEEPAESGAHEQLSKAGMVEELSSAHPAPAAVPAACSHVAPRAPAAFQPGETPGRSGYRILFWGDHGAVVAREDARGYASIDVDFADAGAHAPLSLVDERGADAAALGPAALVLARRTPGLVHVVPLDPDQQDGAREPWAASCAPYDLGMRGDVAAVAAGLHAVYVATTDACLHAVSAAGLQGVPVLLGGSVVAMAARGDALAVLTWRRPDELLVQMYVLGGGKSDAGNSPVRMWQDACAAAMGNSSVSLDVPVRLVSCGSYRVPDTITSPSWLGVGADGSVGVLGGSRLALLFAESWSPRDVEAASGEAAWPVALCDDGLLAVLLPAGASFPDAVPRPLVRSVMLRLPLLDGARESSEDSTASALEAVVRRSALPVPDESTASGRRANAAADRATLSLVASAVAAGRPALALELCGLLRGARAWAAAADIARHAGHAAFAEHILRVSAARASGARASDARASDARASDAPKPAAVPAVPPAVPAVSQSSILAALDAPIVGGLASADPAAYVEVDVPLVEDGPVGGLAATVGAEEANNQAMADDPSSSIFGGSLFGGSLFEADVPALPAKRPPASLDDILGGIPARRVR